MPLKFNHCARCGVVIPVPKFPSPNKCEPCIDAPTLETSDKYFPYIMDWGCTDPSIG